MKVRIIKGRHWYEDRVGEVLEVEERYDSDGDYTVVGVPDGLIAVKGKRWLLNKDYLEIGNENRGWKWK